MTSPSRGGYYVIVGGVLLHLALGTTFMFGSIQPYVASYLRLYDPSITVEDTSMIFSVISLVFATCVPLAGLLQFRFGLRGCAAIGASLLGCSTITCSMVTTLEGIAVMNAIAGLGVAIAGYAWMPDQKGLVSGIFAAGNAAGAAVFNSLATWRVNPENASPDPKTGFFSEEIARRVPMMYVILGMSYLLLGMWALCCCHLPHRLAQVRPHPMVEEAFPRIVGKYASLADVSTTTKEAGKSVEEGDNGTDKGDGNVAHEMGAGQYRQYECLELLKELDFYALSVTMALTVVSGQFIGGNYKRIAQHHFPGADCFLSVLGCAAYVCNGVGRMIVGLVLDRVSYRSDTPFHAWTRFGCLSILVMMSASSTVLLIALSLIPATRALFFLATCLLLFMYGGNFVVFPMLTANMFGITKAGPNYGLVFSFYGVTCFTVMLWLAELTTTNEIYFSCGVLYCAGTLSAVSLWVRRYRQGLPM